MKKYYIFILFFTISFFSGCQTAEENNIVRIPFSFEGKLGYLNSALQVVIKPQYSNFMNPLYSVHFSAEGYAVVRFDSGHSKTAIIDTNGTEVLSLSKGWISYVCGDLYHIEDTNISRIKNNYIIRLKDKKIIAKQTDYTGPASKDEYILGAFFKEGDWKCFIDSGGNRVLMNLILGSSSYSFFEQRAVVCNYIAKHDWDKTWIIDTKGNTVGNILFKFLGNRFSEGLLPAWSKDERKGYVNKSGEFEFTLPSLVMYGWGSLAATEFSDGYAAFQTGESPDIWRIINNKGQMVSENLYVTEMEKFSDGLSLVWVYNQKLGENRGGYVNTSGEYLVKPVLDDADDFHNGYARIKYNGREGLIKTNGKVIWSSNIMQGIITEEELQ